MCLTTVVLARGASGVGFGAAGQVALQRDPREPGDWRENAGRPLFLCRHCTWEPFVRNWTSDFVKNLLYAPRQPKATPMATQGSSKWSKGCPKGPKGTPKAAQGKKKEVERHPKENSKSQTYIHIHKVYANSRCTAIQRPASNIIDMKTH